MGSLAEIYVHLRLLGLDGIWQQVHDDKTSPSGLARVPASALVPGLLFGPTVNLNSFLWLLNFSAKQAKKSPDCWEIRPILVLVQ